MTRLIALAFLTLLLAGPASAATSALITATSTTATSTTTTSAGTDAALPTIPDGLTPQEALKFVAGLSDPAARLLLLETIEARTVEADRPQGGGGLASHLARMRIAIQTHARQLATAGAQALDGVVALPGELDRIIHQIGRDSFGLVGTIGFALATILGGFAVRAAVRRGTATARATLESGDGGGFLSKCLHLFLRAVLDLLGILAFFAFGFVVPNIVLAGDGEARSFVGSYVIAAVIILTAATVSRFLLAPRTPSLRLIAMSDDAAILADKAILILISVSTTAWMTTAYLLLHGRPPEAVHQALVLITGFIVLATVVWLVWMARDPVSLALAPAAGASSTVGKLHGALARNWHWGMTFYIAVVALVWADGHLIYKESVLWQALASIAIVLLVPAVDRVLGRANRQFVNALVVRPPPPVLVGGGEEGGPPPALPEAPDDPEPYIQVIQRGLRIILAVVAAVTVFGMWGVDLLKAIGAPGIQELNQALFDVIVVVILAFVLWQLAEAALTRKTRRRVSRSGVDWDDGPTVDAGVEEYPDDALPQARAMTLLPLIRRFILIVLTVMVVMISLSSLGVDIGPLLAGAGVVGLAIGFGAQTLVRDVVSGVFFLIDDAFRIGEYIEMGDLRGEVEAISIRSIRLRHHRGAIHTVPFGELKYITNYNRDWVIYKMNFRVAPDTDPQKLKKIIKGIGAEMIADEVLGPKFLEPLKSQGVFAIDDDSALIFRVKFMAKPREQFVLRREAYHRIQKAFAEAGIELARRKVEVVVPPAVAARGDALEIAEAAAGAAEEQSSDGANAGSNAGTNTDAR